MCCRCPTPSYGRGWFSCVTCKSAGCGIGGTACFSRASSKRWQQVAIRLRQRDVGNSPPIMSPDVGSYGRIGPSGDIVLSAAVHPFPNK